MDIIGSINTRFIKKNEQGKKEIINKINNIALSGANIIRMNLSHSKHEEVLFCINYIRDNHKDIKILLDLQGNKVRVSNILKETFKVKKDDLVYFCSEDTYEIYREHVSENNLIPLNVKNKFIYNRNFKKIFMKDATMEFNVINNKNGLIKSKVELGGVVRSEKGCNLPLLDRKGWGLTDKDKEDICFALNNGIDIIAYSYCSYVDECKEFKNYVFRNVMPSQILPKLWGKIETNDGLNNIKDIAEELDGIVIARGDLSAEIGIKNVPIAQEKILYTLKKQNKEIIVATNVLGSMNKVNIKNPTINELSDIYNLIKYGASGFMLAGETSIGKNEKDIVKELKYITDYYSRLIKKLKKETK